MWIIERMKVEVPGKRRKPSRLNAGVEALEGRQLLAFSPGSLSNLAAQIGGLGGGGGAASWEGSARPIRGGRRCSMR